MFLTKKIKLKINIVSSIIIAFAILCVVNFFASRYYKRFDLSKAQFYTLSQKTLQVLEQCSEPVNVYVFFPPSNFMYGRIERLLKEYQGHCRNIQVEYVDADRDLARAKMLTEKYKLEIEDIVIFEYKGRTKYVGSHDIAEYDYRGVLAGKPPVFKAFRGEAGFTSAILNLIQEKQETIHFLMGHGEKLPGDFSDDGLSEAAKILKEDNYNVDQINLIGKEAWPSDVKTLVIAGPDKSFLEEEINFLKSFLENGGQLFVMLDPLAKTGLKDLLIYVGVLVGDNIVVDPERKLPFVSSANLFITEYSPHPITASLNNVFTIYYLARSISKLEFGGKFDVVQLTQTSKRAWGERNPEKDPFVFEQDKDLDGPVCISVAANAKHGEGRLVVIGDSDFIKNSQIANVGNVDFFANCINWLMGADELIAIGPKIPERINMTLSAAQMRLVLWLFVLGVPILWIIVGIFVYWKRR